MKRIIASFALAILVLLSAQPVSAHVFFTGSNSSVSSGVIMHVTPDDDPIAGAEARFYFDIQNQSINTDDYIFKLNITNSKGISEPAATFPAGKNSVTAKYVFPLRGAYTISLQATPVPTSPVVIKEPIDFTYNQQVSRGIAASALDQPRYPWAELGMILTLTVSAVSVVLIITRCRHIIGYTKNR